MKWQVTYALTYLRENIKKASAEHIRDDAIRVSTPDLPEVVVAISDSNTINIELARRYHDEFPDLDFLCGYRKECVWEGEAIRYLENNIIGWGSAGTLGSAILKGSVNTAAHKDFFFSYRLIRQLPSITNIVREFDRIFTITLANERVLRIGMIMEYEPTADAVRTLWDRFGGIDIAWNINPNGYPTQNAIEAGKELGCEVMKWDELKVILQSR